MHPLLVTTIIIFTLLTFALIGMNLVSWGRTWGWSEAMASEELTPTPPPGTIVLPPTLEDLFLADVAEEIISDAAVYLAPSPTGPIDMLLPATIDTGPIELILGPAAPVDLHTDELRVIPDIVVIRELRDQVQQLEVERILGRVA